MVDSSTRTFSNFSPRNFVYRNVKYRSKTEAQWANFLDKMHIRHRYEDKRFALMNGKYYTPDFYLPDYGIYLEVKPSDPIIRNAEREKPEVLASMLDNERVWITHGRPGVFEQLAGPNVQAIPEAIITTDNAIETTEVYGNVLINGFWIIDSRQIACDTPANREKLDNVVLPEALTIASNIEIGTITHPWKNPFIRSAINSSLQLGNPDAMPLSAYVDRLHGNSFVRYGDQSGIVLDSES